MPLLALPPGVVPISLPPIGSVVGLDVVVAAIQTGGGGGTGGGVGGRCDIGGEQGRDVESYAIILVSGWVES